MIMLQVYIILGFLVNVYCRVQISLCDTMVTYVKKLSLYTAFIISFLTTLVNGMEFGYLLKRDVSVFVEEVSLQLKGVFHTFFSSNDYLQSDFSDDFCNWWKPTKGDRNNECITKDKLTLLINNVITFYKKEKKHSNFCRLDAACDAFVEQCLARYKQENKSFTLVKHTAYASSNTYSLNQVLDEWIKQKIQSFEPNKINADYKPIYNFIIVNILYKEIDRLMIKYTEIEEIVHYEVDDMMGCIDKEQCLVQSEVGDSAGCIEYKKPKSIEELMLLQDQFAQYSATIDLIYKDLQGIMAVITLMGLKNNLDAWFKFENTAATLEKIEKMFDFAVNFEKIKSKTCLTIETSRPQRAKLLAHPFKKNIAIDCPENVKSIGILSYPGFNYVIYQNIHSKALYNDIMFNKNFSDEKNKNSNGIALIVLTNNYCIFLNPILQKKRKVMRLLKRYINNNSLIDTQGDKLYFNDAVFTLLDGLHSALVVLIMSNICKQSFNKEKDIVVQDVNRTKQNTIKVLQFLYEEFKKNDCLGVERSLGLENLPLHHVKDLFFVTQYSPFTNFKKKENIFQKDYNYAYFCSNVTGIMKNYVIEDIFSIAEHNKNDRPKGNKKNTNIVELIQQRKKVQAKDSSFECDNSNKEEVQEVEKIVYGYLKKLFFWCKCGLQYLNYNVVVVFGELVDHLIMVTAFYML